MDYRVSVIIPCYNMGDYIEDAVTSVNDLPNSNEIEIIIINDGSDDNDYTKSVIEDLKQDNIKTFHQPNKGLSYTRNFGIEQTNCEFVILLDADNKLSVPYVEEGLSYLKANPGVGIIYGDLIQFGNVDFKSKPGEFDIVKLLVKNYIDACVLLRKTAWKSINGYDEVMKIGYEDWDLNLRLFFKGWEFKYLKKVCFYYRVKEMSMLTEANKNREEIVNYVFSKPQLKHANKLRNIVNNHNEFKDSLYSIQNRKLIKLALKIERLLKSIIK